MRVQQVNNNQQSFGTRLITEQSKYVQDEIKALPESAKRGIKIAERFLRRNKRNNELKLFCANDMVGYGACANYWGIEIKPAWAKSFSECPPKVNDFEVFYKKTPRQVAKVIIDGYNNLEHWG